MTVVAPHPPPDTSAKPQKAAQRTDVPADYWRTRRRSVVVGREDFRFVRRRPGVSSVRLDPTITQFTWDDADTVLRGTLTTTGVEPNETLIKGDSIDCYVDASGSGRFSILWSMQVFGVDKGLVSGAVQVTLADAMERLNLSVDDFRYVRDKAHPKGWLVHEIVRDIAARYGVAIGAIPTTTHRVLNYTATGVSPLTALIDVFKRERTATGKRYFMRMVGSKLWITPLRRSAVLFEMGPTIVDGALHVEGSETYATVLTARGTAAANAASSKKKRKIEVEVRNDRVVRRYGVVHRTVYISDADSDAEVRKGGEAKLAAALKPTRTLSFTHAGIPGVRRGQALRIALPDIGLSQIVYVSSVSHSVAAGSYTMDVEVIFTDPYVDSAADKAAKARVKAAAKSGTKTEASKSKAASASVSPLAAVARPATYAQRRDA